MSNVESVNLISDSKNIILSNEIINDSVHTIENISNHIRSKALTESTQFKSLFTCGGQRLNKLRYDIDINYAIGLLKREDGSVNV
ncbi:radial spoke head protein 4 A-like [Aphis craccivora]|uniref:Radial spoke head protein 4 A-like n=1 Tax=Aphis craccivora TaxID=307492 RepID=A0A6G0YLL7_APHCR|nr:radial spoke head protein 4 A-like [Aphis craccivora]